MALASPFPPSVDRDVAVDRHAVGPLAGLQPDVHRLVLADQVAGGAALVAAHHQVVGPAPGRVQRVVEHGAEHGVHRLPGVGVPGGGRGREGPVGVGDESRAGDPPRHRQPPGRDDAHDRAVDAGVPAVEDHVGSAEQQQQRGVVVRPSLEDLLGVAYRGVRIGVRAEQEHRVRRIGRRLGPGGDGPAVRPEQAGQARVDGVVEPQLRDAGRPRRPARRPAAPGRCCPRGRRRGPRTAPRSRGHPTRPGRARTRRCRDRPRTRRRRCGRAARSCPGRRRSAPAGAPCAASCRSSEERAADWRSSSVNSRRSIPPIGRGKS